MLDPKAIDAAAHVFQECIAEAGGPPSEHAADYVQRIVGAYLAGAPHAEIELSAVTIDRYAGRATITFEWPHALGTLMVPQRYVLSPITE